MKFFLSISILFSLFLGTAKMAHAQTHPRLMLTPEGVTQIRSQLGKASLFDEQLAQTIQEVEAEIAKGIFVPIPKDMAGGYTHERHKQNFFVLQKAGNLFQITAEEKYAIYIRDMLLEYAEMFPTLGLHPTNRSYATGKIFWQCLNDANWLVYVSQAYDCIYDWLKPEQVRYLNQTLFRPFADFISVENPQFFNRIHNHSTWANAAVGMIGLVMDDEELVKRALYGLRDDGIAADSVDNDGGYIKVEGVRKAGFLAQLDFSFSPDGYFTEGPYYLRYAMSPFLLFGKSLVNNRPDIDILAYREGILMKAVYALLNQTDAQGQFFPINDAQKGMSWRAREVISAVDIAYYHGGRDPRLLSIAQKQQTVQLDETGFAVASDIEKGLSKGFQQESVAYRDGADGQQGGVGILRTSKDHAELCAVFKYSAHGMGHGHFDKLSYSLYDERGEIIQDYGAARWVNIDQKGGGRYLPENKTFAKQSIAHNTLIVNETSHYEGKIKKGEAHHPDPYYFNVSDENIQIVSAKERHAYPGTEMHRTLLLLKDDHFQYPILIDVLRVHAEVPNQYDLPIWFQGHLLQTDFEYEAEQHALVPLGQGHGYQHIWREAVGKPEGSNARLTWFDKGRFYSMTSWVSEQDELIFARAGAHDPHFNLRHDPAYIIRKQDTQHALFLSLIEPHGSYNPVAEIPHTPFSQVDSIELLHDSEDYTAFSFEHQDGTRWMVMLANQQADETATHTLTIDKVTYQWQGPFELKKLNL
ncbi:MAG: heparinase II/III family protein [Bacteroidota bacterium]